MKKNPFKISYKITKTSFVARCENCDYEGEPKSTQAEAAVDARNHKISNPNHVVLIDGHQVRNGSYRLENDELNQL